MPKSGLHNMPGVADSSRSLRIFVYLQPHSLKFPQLKAKNEGDARRDHIAARVQGLGPAGHRCPVKLWPMKVSRRNTPNQPLINKGHNLEADIRLAECRNSARRQPRWLSQIY